MRGTSSAALALTRDICAVLPCGWVCAVFADVSRRRDTLTFYHHEVVASLPRRQQDKWLDRAEREGWSATKLQAALLHMPRSSRRRRSISTPRRLARLRRRRTSSHASQRYLRGYKLNCKLPSLQVPNPCNLKPDLARKIDSRSAGEALFIGEEISRTTRITGAVVQKAPVADASLTLHRGVIAEDPPDDLV